MTELRDFADLGIAYFWVYLVLMTIAAIDHAAVPIENVEQMLASYASLGFSVRSFNSDGLPVHAVMLGNVRLNFHEPKTWKEVDFPRGPNALPGCGDFCFVWDGTVEDAMKFIKAKEIQIEFGPVERTGARAQSQDIGDSIYFRDPDQNLLEIIAYR